jgi:uncharacterized alpha/beta hydrolase family protein
MKISANTIFGSIISVILLFMIFWMVSIQTTTDYDPTKHTLENEKVKQIDPTLALSVKRGKKLFLNKSCSSCHRVHSRHSILTNIKERREIKWLIEYIKDEQVLINQNEPDVIALNAEWNSNKSEHYNPNLSESDIMDILSYVDGY